MNHQKVRGFSLLEVMIAVLVFSVGLLGAGLMTTSAVKNSNNSYQRSQASFLADALVDRMRSNPRQIWLGGYTHARAAGTPALPNCGNGGATGCTLAQIATRDLSIMGTSISTQLPNGTFDIACVLPAMTPAATAPSTTEPVFGACMIGINWAESRDVDSNGFAGVQTFELVVQP